MSKSNLSALEKQNILFVEIYFKWLMMNDPLLSLADLYKPL